MGFFRPPQKRTIEDIFGIRKLFLISLIIPYCKAFFTIIRCVYTVLCQTHRFFREGQKERERHRQRHTHRERRYQQRERGFVFCFCYCCSAYTVFLWLLFSLGLVDLESTKWPTFLQMTQFHSFLWLSNIPLYICTTSSLSIHRGDEEGLLGISLYFFK